MAGTVLDDIELIIEDIRGGGGKPPSRDDNHGGDDGGGRTPEPRGRDSRMYSAAVVLGMVSILVLFLVVVVAFVFLRIKNSHAWSGVALPRILWINTVILLLSSATLDLARRRLKAGDPRAFRLLWSVTILLGGLFVGGQFLAWLHLAERRVLLSSPQASGFFYTFTALHAAHLLGGICALLYVALRKFDSGHVSRTLAAQVTSYYWHFMDGLWLFLLALLYVGR